MNPSLTYNKQQALAEIVDLATRNNISAQDIAQALGDSQSAHSRAHTQKSTMSRLFSAIGGTLVLSGLCVFVSMWWDDFTPFFRVLITFGSGTALFIAAMACARHPARQALVTPLVLVSALFQPAGLLVLFAEYGNGGDWRHAALAINGVLMLQYALSFYSVRRGLLSALALLFGGAFFAVAGDLLDIAENIILLTLGFSYLCLASGLDRLAPARRRGLWHCVGGLLLLAGFYDVVRDGVFEITFPGLCALLVYLSIVVKNRGLLMVATLALICYIGDYAYDVFANNGMFPLALMAAGGIFMGLGSLAMRLDRRFIRQG